MKNAISDIKSLGPLKFFKTRSGSYSCLGLSIYVKDGIQISLDCPFEKRKQKGKTKQKLLKGQFSLDFHGPFNAVPPTMEREMNFEDLAEKCLRSF